MRAPSNRKAEVDSLVGFLSDLQKIQPSEPDASLNSLKTFLINFREMSDAVSGLSPPRGDTLPNVDALKDFCGKFRLQFEQLHRAGKLIDFWTVAGLRRDEIRHASVLAWLLNPKESHGFGNTVFQSWMRGINFSDGTGLNDQRIWDAEYRVTTEVRVSTEVDPLTESTSRLDIEINSKRFYLCVEVKIDAPEGKDQLRRYVEIASKRAEITSVRCRLFGSRQIGTIREIPQYRSNYVDRVFTSRAASAPINGLYLCKLFRFHPCAILRPCRISIGPRRSYVGRTNRCTCCS